MSELEVIGRARLFEQLTKEQTERVWQLLTPARKRLYKDDVIVEDGQMVSFCGIVEKGSLAASKLYADGYLSLMLKFAPAYTLGMDIAATKTKVSTYYVSALTDSVVWIFDYDKIAKPGTLLEAERLLIMESLLALVAGENLRKMNKIEILSRKGSRERIMTFLAFESSFYRSSEFDVPYNREEMASFLCLNRSRLSHELSLMRQEGILDYDKNHFKILEEDWVSSDEVKRLADSVINYY